MFEHCNTVEFPYKLLTFKVVWEQSKFKGTAPDYINIFILKNS
jgi:hypothetical protein